MRRIPQRVKTRIETNNESDVTSEKKTIVRSIIKDDTVISSNINYEIYNSPDYKYDESVCICIVLDEIPDSNTIVKLSTLRLLFRYSFLVISYNFINQQNAYYKNICNSMMFYDSDETKSRNLYLNFVKQNKSKFDYMIVIDKDTLDSNIHANFKPKMFNCFTYSDKWDVVFANQTYKYYDIDSLITNETKEYHAEQNEEIKDSIRKRLQYHIPSDSELIPVKSAFGGLGIYKTYVLNDTFYSDDGHISFNLRISENYKLFIDPSLLIETSTNLSSFFM